MPTPFSNQFAFPTGNDIGGAGFPPQGYGTHLSSPLTAAFDAPHLFSNSPVQVVSGGTVTSVLVNTMDFQAASVGFLASGDLTLTLQPYLDAQGQIPLTAITASAGVSGVVSTPQGLIFRSLQVSLTNSGATTVALNDLLLVCRAMY